MNARQTKDAGEDEREEHGKGDLDHELGEEEGQGLVQSGCTLADENETFLARSEKQVNIRLHSYIDKHGESRHETEDLIEQDEEEDSQTVLDACLVV